MSPTVIMPAAVSMLAATAYMPAAVAHFISSKVLHVIRPMTAPPVDSNHLFTIRWGRGWLLDTSFSCL